MNFIEFKKDKIKELSNLLKLTQKEVKAMKVPPLYASKLIKDTYGIEFKTHHEFGEHDPLYLYNRDIPLEKRNALRLWLFRNSRCLSLSQLSKRVGKAKSTLSMYESGKYPIPVEFMKKLNKKYNAGFDYGQKPKLIGDTFAERFRNLTSELTQGQIYTKYGLNYIQYSLIIGGAPQTLPIKMLKNLLSDGIDLNKLIGD